MNIIDIVRDTLGGMATGPKPLNRMLQFFADDENILPVLLAHLREAGSADQVFNLFNHQLSKWDYEASNTWIGDTDKNTVERRVRICALLQISEDEIAFLNDKFPPNLKYERPVVIARTHRPWYDLARRSRDSFYRDAYARYLREHRQWSEAQVGDMEESSRLVTERLSDPENAEIFPVRGLVVGYVQSGKTANFTGVIARAADAGYRLLIVLAGTLNILRAQTQRRIDRELIGKPFITAENEVKYASDLGDFIDHGGFPSDTGGFNWHRLTNIEGDYKRLRQGIQSLEFRRHDKTKPFNDRDNLSREDARILIVKKVPSVLIKVAADLDAIKSRLEDIPTLVIDDESDQASVNTKKPTQEEIEERTATNSAIVSLLTQLPRAQYVGYTATPFANVFIDPNIAENLFPKDFIISLPRPANYMGISDFHDIDRDDKTRKGPNEKAFVRDVRGDDGDAQNMQRAVDSYILTGAIKLFRRQIRFELAKNYRHHTMLVHSSQLTKDHGTIAEVIRAVLDQGGYLTGKAWSRLGKLWESDFAPVSAERSNGYPIPETFDQIRPFLSECWGRLTNGPKSILIVNGDKNDNPDFESESVWKIIVGGAKLSRGYTIEGLTISYYRRRAAAADTLMQMGRWFGFRDGYLDLVRLYIGREEHSGKGTVDLYAAFEGVCRDELEFRNELKKYAFPEDGKPILPVQVPPLVPSHLLQPTAKNKMYNAVVDFQNFGTNWKEPTLAPFEDAEIKKNQQLLLPLLSGIVHKGRLSITVPDEEDNPERPVSLSARWTEVSGGGMLVFLKSYVWIDKDKGVLHREIQFLESKEKTCVDKWLFLCIEGPTASDFVDLAGHQFRPFNRSRVGTQERFGVYSEIDHRHLAMYLCGVGEATSNDEVTKRLRSARQGVFVFYPTRDLLAPESSITPGFALQFPPNEIVTPIRFGVRIKNKPEAVVVNI